MARGFSPSGKTILFGWRRKRLKTVSMNGMAGTVAVSVEDFAAGLKHGGHRRTLKIIPKIGA
jgi:hypothetical protein